MEGKAALMVESQRLGMRVDALEKEVSQLQTDLSKVPLTLQSQKASAISVAQGDFVNKKSADLEKIEQVVACKRSQVVELIDSFPDMDTKEIAGRFEIRDLEDHLMEVYPPDLIADYVCLNPIPVSDDAEAYKLYSSVEGMVAGLSQRNVAATVFKFLSDLLEQASEVPSVGIKAGLIMFALFAGLLVFSPFLFIVLFTSLGLLSGGHGLFVHKLLRRLYSVKLYIQDNYDVDAFMEDKGDILRSVDDFLHTAKEEALGIVNARQFDPSSVDTSGIEKTADLETIRLKAAIDIKNKELETVRQGLASVLEQLEALQKEDAAKAEKARTEALTEITWKNEWMNTVFLEVTPEKQVKVFKYAKGNSIYYGADIEQLKNLSRLIVIQSVLHMHPDISSNIVLDYKYNGGTLTQFSIMPARCLKLAYSENDLQSQEDSILRKIRARTNNVLSSSESIEEYNNLMHEYGSAGEYYLTVHIFGLEKCSVQLRNNIVNGPRVGVYYKLYLTQEELIELGEDLPISSFQDFYEVRENPMPRLVGQVKRLWDGDA